MGKPAAIARNAAGTAAAVNASLVGAGIGVRRLEPVRHSLEQRFLEITARLDASPEAEAEKVKA